MHKDDAEAKRRLYLALAPTCRRVHVDAEAQRRRDAGTKDIDVWRDIETYRHTD